MTLLTLGFIWLLEGFYLRIKLMPWLTLAHALERCKERRTQRKSWRFLYAALLLGKMANYVNYWESLCNKMSALVLVNFSLSTSWMIKLRAACWLFDVWISRFSACRGEIIKMTLLQFGRNGWEGNEKVAGYVGGIYTVLEKAICSRMWYE